MFRAQLDSYDPAVVERQPMAPSTWKRTPGGTQRRAIGNSVISVSASDVAQTVVVSDISDLMGGRTRGLQFKGMAAGVGTGSGMQIRGVGSFNLSSNWAQKFIRCVSLRLTSRRVSSSPSIG